MIFFPQCAILICLKKKMYLLWTKNLFWKCKSSLFLQISVKHENDGKICFDVLLYLESFVSCCLSIYVQMWR